MAHIRERALTHKILKSLKQSPTLSLLGMRQTGKTTILRQLCTSYFTLDHDRTRFQFEAGEWAALDQAKPPVAIDEAQKMPGIFDHVKLLADQQKQMGRFILTGSVRFLSKRQIRESLTGRTQILELTPMTLAETHGKLGRVFLDSLYRAKSFNDFVTKWGQHVWCSNAIIKQNLECGGLPGICFRRDKLLRNDLFELQIETLLSRDLPLLYETKVIFEKRKRLLVELSQNQGLKVSVESLARKLNISAPTTRALIEAYTGLYLIRRLGDVYYVEDSGLAGHLNHGLNVSPDQVYRSLVFRELNSGLLNYFPRSAKLTSYSTRGGVDVPFTIHLDHLTLGFAVDASENVSEKSLKSLGKFAKSKERSATVRKIAFHLGENAYESSNGAWCLPITYIA